MAASFPSFKAYHAESAWTWEKLAMTRARVVAGDTSLVAELEEAIKGFLSARGLQVALTLSGAILTERTFNWPGLGTELVQYVTARDYVAVQGLVTFFALVVVIVSLLVDIVNALVDPRVRY